MKRNHINHPFKAYTGIAWSKAQVNQYNAYQDKINRWYDEMGYIPEQLLNGSHNLFDAFSSPAIKSFNWDVIKRLTDQANNATKTMDKILSEV
jgi:hypothetical protein